MTGVDQLRNESGQLPAYAWPGGYPIVYLTQYGNTVCPECANDPDPSETIVSGDVYWEGAPMCCDRCTNTIESAYGDPEVSA